MESLVKECTTLKHEYEQCFNKWYTERFLKGDVTPVCDKVFAEYQACVRTGMQQMGLAQLLDDTAKHNDPITVPAGAEKGTKTPPPS